jgi:hypothetical protein
MRLIVENNESVLEDIAIKEQEELQRQRIIALYRRDKGIKAIKKLEKMEQQKQTSLMRKVHEEREDFEKIVNNAAKVCLLYFIVTLNSYMSR